MAYTFEAKPTPRFSRGQIILSVTGIILLLLAWLLFWPVDMKDISTTRIMQALNYEDAIDMVGVVERKDDASINPVCKTKLLTHGQQTERVVVLFHGFTNCPKQFELLGKQLFDLGYNVYIPRLPYHGLEDRMNTEFEKLNAADLWATTNESINIAVGLGKHVSIAGLSSSGVAVGLAAQNRTDVDLAMVIAPSLGSYDIPAWATPPFRNVILRIPNWYRWWDDVEKDVLEGPGYVYPRYSTRAFGEVVRLGSKLLQESERLPLSAKKVIVVTTAADKAINRDLLQELVKNWEARMPTVVTEYEFPLELKITHDMIDPNQPDQHIDQVYPELIKLLQS